ncbi:hypothetical protein BC829DRAFT_448793 [Chytridium lagenaria]|nr:hypothetical protein BC829DRAFT_448793 [Chytridium lagenaria]
MHAGSTITTLAISGLLSMSTFTSISALEVDPSTVATTMSQNPPRDQDDYNSVWGSAGITSLLLPPLGTAPIEIAWDHIPIKVLPVTGCSIIAPICGSDGQTYLNSCVFAKTACVTGITTLHDGRCNITTPTIFTTGQVVTLSTTKSVESLKPTTSTKPNLIQSGSASVKAFAGVAAAFNVAFCAIFA